MHLSLTFPGEGGTVTFIERGFGKELLGSSMNVLLVSSYVVLLAVLRGSLWHLCREFLSRGPGSLLARRSAFGCHRDNAVINLLGPSLVDRPEGFFDGGKLSILTTFVIAGLAGGLAFSRLGPSDRVPLPKIVSTGMLVLSYEGFELIANASDRVPNPQCNLPVACYAAC